MRHVNAQNAPVATGLSVTSPSEYVMTPISVGKERGIRVRGCETIASIGYICGSSIALRETINPRNETLFQKLAVSSQNYEKFKLKKIRLVYRGSCSTSTSGTIAISYQPDPAAVAPSSVVEVGQLECSAYGSSWASFETKMVSSDGTDLFVRSNLASLPYNFLSGVDTTVAEQLEESARLTSAGLVQVVLEGFPMSTSSTDLRLGYLSIDYEIDLWGQRSVLGEWIDSAFAYSWRIVGGTVSSYIPWLNVLDELGNWGYNAWNAAAGANSGTHPNSSTQLPSSASSLLVRGALYAISCVLELSATSTPPSVIKNTKLLRNADLDFEVVDEKSATALMPGPRPHKSRIYLSPAVRNRRLKAKKWLQRGYVVYFDLDEFNAASADAPALAGDLTWSLVLGYRDPSGVANGTFQTLQTATISGGTGEQTIDFQEQYDMTTYIGTQWFPTPSATPSYASPATGYVFLQVIPTGSETRYVNAANDFGQNQFSISRIDEESVIT